MGWFGGWFGGGGGSSSSGESDPWRNLDPKLREFLEKESPVRYMTASEEQQQQQNSQPPRPLPQQQQQQQQSPQQGIQDQQQPTGDDAAGTGAVPRESLFQDGRYAHLWKTYRPLAAVESETKTDHEKLMDVLEAFKERKAQIGRAALENCADEQLEWNLCMKEGDWAKRVTMCREEVQRFERCYMTQSRLLKALGYLSAYDRPPEVDEQIQMRADALFHRMLEQEAAVERAKVEGKLAPTFPPLLGGQRATTTATALPAPVPVTRTRIESVEPPSKILKEWREKLEKLPEQDRAAEEEALRAEYRAKAELAGHVQSIWQEQAKEREARKAQGKETIGDKVRGLFAGR